MSCKNAQVANRNLCKKENDNTNGEEGLALHFYVGFVSTFKVWYFAKLP